MVTIKDGVELPIIPPQKQADIALNQANPTQNFWYECLATTPNCRLQGVSIRVETTGETVETRITVDGVVYTTSQAAVADTTYYLYWSTYYGGVLFGVSATDYGLNKPFWFDCRRLKIEVRKTTNTGAGNLHLGAVYYRW